MREIPTAIRAKYQLAMNMMETQQMAPRIDRDLQGKITSSHSWIATQYSTHQ